MSVEQIKEDLARCGNVLEPNCEECPYFNEVSCFNHLIADTLKCIGELEEKVNGCSNTEGKDKI